MRMMTRKAVARRRMTIREWTDDNSIYVGSDDFDHPCRWSGHFLINIFLFPKNISLLLLP